MRGKIIGFVGPSGAGKQFSKQAILAQLTNLKELTVFTTRPQRMTDGIDRKAGLSVEYFLAEARNGNIIAAHQPFGSRGDWYGFSGQQIDELLSSGNEVLTEVHVDNVQLFKERYSRDIYLIGLMASGEYLDYNIKLRGSESGNDRMLRLAAAEKECRTIRELYLKGLVDEILEVGWHNRKQLAEIVVDKAWKIFKPQASPKDIKD